jgi:hypothetical protein
MAESRSEKQQRKDLEAFRSAFQDTQPPSPSKVTNRSFTPQARRPDPSHSHDLSPRQGTLTSILATVGQLGFTHPNYGHYLMLPPEFDVLLALERKPVVQVVLEIMRATMGWVDDSGEEDAQGRPKRREWARLVQPGGKKNPFFTRSGSCRMVMYFESPCPESIGARYAGPPTSQRPAVGG